MHRVQMPHNRSATSARSYGADNAVRVLHGNTLAVFGANVAPASFMADEYAITVHKCDANWHRRRDVTQLTQTGLYLYSIHEDESTQHNEDKTATRNDYCQSQHINGIHITSKAQEELLFCYISWNKYVNNS